MHEYWQIHDGSLCAVRLCAVRLCPDLSRAIEAPVTLFYASAAPWQGQLSEQQLNEENFVTDGPFLHRTQSGVLLMLWSSYVRGCYVLGTLRSHSGSVLGPWSHNEGILYSDDGGHGMLFRTFEGDLMLSLHTQKAGWGKERAVFIPLREEGDRLLLQ